MCSELDEIRAVDLRFTVEEAAAYFKVSAGLALAAADVAVLQHQPGTIRGFLLNTAVLDQLTGPLCDALTGRSDGSAMVAALERANLFTVPLDDRREWCRCHHLFADVLRARLLSEHPEQIPLLHQFASRWHESQDQTEEALRHALAGLNFHRAVHLMEAAVPAFGVPVVMRRRLSQGSVGIR